MRVLLDLFCGRWGWSRAFAKRGWHCIGVDLTEPPEVPEGCAFIPADVLRLKSYPFQKTVALAGWQSVGFYSEIWNCQPDAIVASPPCEEFSVHGMKHFHPNPKYPANGIRLFEHTRALCEASGLPYVIENVRPAQKFIGNSTCHAGAFHIWHNLGNFPLHFGHPFRMPKGISKGFGDMSTKHYHENLEKISPHIRARNTATIPPELANTVAEFTERILESRKVCA